MKRHPLLLNPEAMRHVRESSLTELRCLLYYGNSRRVRAVARAELNRRAKLTGGDR